VRPSAHLLLYLLGITKAETQVTPAERECLLDHASGRRLGAEIGVWHGVTTSALRRAMDASGTLYAIDPFPIGRVGFSMQRFIASREVRQAKGAAVQFLRLTGTESGQRFLADGLHNFDFVFIDGDHSYEGLQGDWQQWSRLVQAGGCIALHDSRSSESRNIEGAGSVRFTKQVIRENKAFEVVSEVESLTVVRRKN